MKKIITFVSICILAGTSVFYYGCSSTGSDTDPGLSSRPETITYTGPGSYYSVVMNADGTFEMEVSEAYGENPIIEIDGTYEMLSNGFIRFTVEDSNNTEDGPDTGEQALGIEVVGYGMFFMPISGSELIPLLEQGTCPDGDFSANWITAQARDDKDASSTDDEFFGTFNYDHSELVGAVGIDANLVDYGPSEEGKPVSVGECENGFLQLFMDDKVVANMWLTSEGAMVETFDEDEKSESYGERNSTIFALPADAEAKASDLEGVWRGLVFVDHDEGDSEEISLFVEITLNSTGEGIGRAFTDLETFKLEDSGVNINISKNSDIGNGWFTGSLVAVQSGEESEESGNIACAPSRDVGDIDSDVMLCIAQDPGNNENHINIILVKSE